MMINRLGWIPDHPDIRDFSCSIEAPSAALPTFVDLRPHCPPIYDQKALGSCHDAETEVLTDSGWKLFSVLDGSERLATVNPETAELFFEIPTRIIRMPYQGEMVCGKSQTIDFRVTPDHSMLVRKWNEKKRTLDDKYRFVPAKNIGWYAGLLNRVVWNGETRSDTFTLPGVAHKHKEQRAPRVVDMEAWLRFIGIYLAEGTMLKSDQRPGCISYKVQIAASKDREKGFVRDTLRDIGVHALELGDRFTFENRQVYEAMESLGLKGVKAPMKFVPRFVFKQPAAMIREFLKGHFYGDGSEQRGLRAHYTSSSILAKDIQLLAFLSGSESRISVRSPRVSMTADGRTITGRFDEHRVSICERKNLSIGRTNTIRNDFYSGEVFCAEVPSFHTLVTRRNGSILISGNCTGNAIAAVLEYDQIKQSMKYEFTPSRLFIYYNERSMEGTIDSDSGAQIRDGIKAVNKWGACPESDWPYVVSKFAQKPPAVAYKDATFHKALKYARVPVVLRNVQSVLAAGFPIVFGFSVYSSFMTDEVAASGIMPMPLRNESAEGGHAVVMVGYSQQSWTDKQTGKQLPPGLIVRNSWGASWGLSGNFVMPFGYVNSNLSDDYWQITLVN